MRFCAGAVLLITSAYGFSPAIPHRWIKVPALQAASEISGSEADRLPNPPINWLPPLRLEPESEPSPGSTVYPLFPLGSVTYLPNSEHVLSIFEPRYRKMYNDILFSGGRSFAVCTVDGGGRFSEAASIFYLEELKEVSEQTKDQVKYVCQHRCTKRVKLKRVLNPAAWTKDTANYLKVEVEDILDDGTPPAAAAQAPTDEDLFAGAGAVTAPAATEAATEAAALAVGAYAEDMQTLCSDMDSVVELMTSFKEEPRFSPQVKGVFTPQDFAAVGADGDNKLWQLASLWQSFAQERMNHVERQGTADIQAVIMAHVTKNGTKSMKELAGRELTIPPALQKEVEAMTKRVREAMGEKLEATTVPYQQMLQEPSRGERVRVLRRVVLEEKLRLAAKQSLRNLFPTESKNSGGEDEGEDGSSGGGSDPSSSSAAAPDGSPEQE
eukprot:CAMPEP_0171682484 /NCGR_PEP_ID=MMETSP0991-20121206/557_1 /TAXON_ID=483369 /ORGANISM="non described non described, Strain CCMP2098" /LENGTH=438 /DNA_ID=CAMNT_0012269703 /DNA_START=56 /DNA_END=1372 /DNA_ORIENTATION=-